ncbi:MAG: YfhO family protein [Lachnospiraceae bacterium]|nr:YfhO family protein [Lachnospiraceae bacterium]
METGTGKTKQITGNLLAFVIPIVIMTGICFKYGFYPFGDKSILMADMRYQFVDYYGYLKQIVFGNDDIFYTFSKTFGGDMAGLLAYYCNAPFVLLLAFVQNADLPGAILIIMILMLGFSSLNFNILLNHTFGVRWGSVIFSVAYAFIGYLMGYFNCTQYFFNIMLLPLMVLGIIKTIKEKQVSFLYILILALSIFSNYYIGYMECLFSALFFAYYFLSEYQSLEEIKENVRTVVIYACTSVLGVLISTVSLLCAVFSLRGQKNIHSFIPALNFNVADFFSGLYTGAFHGNVSDGLPLIYCGILSTALSILYFFNKKIKTREKIYAAAVLFILLMSFLIEGFMVIWHGFAYPIGFPYRNSFLFSFFLIFIAYKCFINIFEGVTLRDLIIVFSIFFLYSVYLILSNNAYAGRHQIIFTMVLLCAVLVTVRFCREGKQYMMPLIIGLLVIGCADAGLNAYYSIGSYFPELYSSDDNDLAKFQDYVTETEDLLSMIDEHDQGLFRIEKLYRRSNNDAMLFGYNGLSHFSSCETREPKAFLGTLGFRDNDNWAYYGVGSTTFADSFMGVKYLLSQFDSTAKPYPGAGNAHDKYIYENPYALGFGFVMGSDADRLSLKHSGDLFEYQNDIAGSFYPADHKNRQKIFRPVKNVKMRLENVKRQYGHFTRVNSDRDAYVEFSFTAENGDFIYMHLDADSTQNTRTVINDLEKEPYFTEYGWSVREVGYYEPGERVNVRLYLEQDEITLYDQVFYYEDITALSQWYEEAMSSPVSTEKIKSSHLAGSADVSMDEGFLVFSIPYDECWKVYLDGEKKETVKIMDGLLAVRITGGKHTFELKYMPKGIVVGTPVSVLALLVTVILFVTERRKKTVPGPKKDDPIDQPNL